MSLRFPVLIWPDAAGGSSAVLLGDFTPAAASGATEAEVLRHLKELLEWRMENEPWNVNPDFLEPALLEVKVEVRPQYRTRRRVVPCPEKLSIRVPCVLGRQENGLRLCLAPHFNVQFNFHEDEEVKSLVAHYVLEALQNHTPAQLATVLPPAGCRLGELVLRDTSQRIRRIPPSSRPELKALFAVADPLLHDHSRTRTVSAAYGREALVATLVRKLEEEKASVLLVGGPGSGKSTVLFDAVRTLSRRSQVRDPDCGEDPDRELRTYRFWRGSAGRMIAGMRYLGEWEERCEAFIMQLGGIEGVFCAGNLLEFLQVGGEGPGDSVGAFLLPYIQRGELRIVAEATPAELEACRRLLPGLLDGFQIVQVPSLDGSAAERVLNQIAGALAGSSKRPFAPGAIPLACRLFRRFQPYAAFPGPAAGFVRELFEARLPAGAAQKPVDADAVVASFVRRTGLPELLLRDDMPLSADEVRRHFAGQIIGQTAATSAAARLVATIKAGLNDPQRPLGVLLFCGPTGVGKTALARLLVDYCFGSGGQKDRLVRLDMSEFSGWGGARRLLQNPQGRPAAWIESVRRQPFCVVLFDEIEKAAPDVFDVLLGLLDEGRLTDPFGRVTWFRSAIIIMTSNLGSGRSRSAGFAPASEPAYESEVASFFRPEFFNRLDSVIPFNPLGPDEVKAIVRKEFADLESREGLAAARLKLAWTERLVTAVAVEGYDQRLGARPLQRAIERMVVSRIARWKLENPRVQNATVVLDLGLNDEAVVELGEARL